MGEGIAPNDAMGFEHVRPESAREGDVLVMKSGNEYEVAGNYDYCFDRIPVKDRPEHGVTETVIVAARWASYALRPITSETKTSVVEERSAGYDSSDEQNMSDEHRPLWQVDDCEGHVEFDCTTWPTIQLGFNVDEDSHEHVIHLTVSQAASLIRALNRGIGRTVMNGADRPTESMTGVNDLREAYAQHHVHELDAYGDEEEDAFDEGLRIFDTVFRNVVEDAIEARGSMNRQ